MLSDLFFDTPTETDILELVDQFHLSLNKSLANNAWTWNEAVKKVT
jgi:hypothetical protein